MIEARLKRSDKTYIVLNVPESNSELTLKQKLDFDFAQFHAIQHLKKCEDRIFESRGEYLLILAKGLSEIFEIDLGQILSIDGINILEMSQSEFVEHLETIGGKLTKVNKDQLSESLLSLWNYISDIINQPIDKKQIEIDYKGQKYFLPKYVEDKVNDNYLHGSLTVKQAIEILQVNNFYNNWLKENIKERYSDKDKTILLLKYVSEIVLLLNPDIPNTETEFKVWLDQKIEHFIDIDCKSFMICINWFNDHLAELKKDPENKYFFDSVEEAQTLEEREAAAKAAAKSDRIFKNIGLKGVINKLLIINPFQKNGESKIESINKGPFTDAVKLISTDNANS